LAEVSANEWEPPEDVSRPDLREVERTRRKFVQGSAAVAGGIALSGPLSALDSAAVTYAIWGPFDQASDREADRGNGGSSRARNRAGKGKGAGCSNGSGLRAE